MNKLLVFPIAMMFIISIIVFLATSIQPSGSSENYSDSSGITIIGSNPGNANVSIPKAGPQTFNIWGMSGVLVIIIAAIVVGIISGISILGSGLSPNAQTLIFSSVLFIGLWACLTVVSSTLFFETWLSGILWISLTLVFTVGLGILLTSRGAQA